MIVLNERKFKKSNIRIFDYSPNGSGDAIDDDGCGVVLVGVVSARSRAHRHPRLASHQDALKRDNFIRLFLAEPAR